MAKITAAEAKKLAGLTIEDRVDEVFNLIREAAKNKKRSLALHSEFWARGGYHRTEEWRDACGMLESQGFEVEFFYEEKQFVNMYTVVKW